MSHYNIQIQSHYGAYLSVIMRKDNNQEPNLTEKEKKQLDTINQIAERLNGLNYNLPFHTSTENEKIFFNTTFKFPTQLHADLYALYISRTDKT